MAKEGYLAGNFAIDQQTNPKPEDWQFGAVETINISGVVAGKIDATSNTLGTFQVAVNVTGEQIENNVWSATYPAPAVTGDILTRGTVAINAGKYVTNGSSENKQANVGGAITAEGAITATGYATLAGAIESTKATVALAGHVNATTTGNVKADGNIDITQQAQVTQADIASTKGNITIDNDYTELAWLGVYGGTITATAGSVSLNQAVNKEAGNYLVAEYTNAITAGKDFTMTGLTTTSGAITLSGTATIDVDGQEGNCVAVSGSLAYQLGTDYQLKLLQGYVADLDATAGKVKLTFATTPAYAALGNVTEYDNVQPQNVSVWNGDYEIEKCPVFATDFACDNGRIWTATQLGYLQTQVVNAGVQLRSDIDLNNEEWKGIAPTTDINFTGLLDETKADSYYQFKTISNLNLTNPSSQKTAGFFSETTSDLFISNIKFDGVKTSLDMVSSAVPTETNKAGGDLPKVNMFGIGAVVGKVANIQMSRVSVKLVGGKFGSNGEDNLRSASIGGLIGYVAGWVDLYGVTVDATEATISGWFSLGGLIGHAEGDIVIDLADASAKQKAVQTDVTGFGVNITHVETATANDLYQGMTGRFVGSSYGDVSINDVKPAIVNADFHTKTDGAREDLAFKITDVPAGSQNRHHFGRTAQTLVGHDGMYTDNAQGYSINEVQYQIYMEFGTNYTPGVKHLYDLTIEPHQN